MNGAATAKLAQERIYGALEKEEEETIREEESLLERSLFGDIWIWKARPIPLRYRHLERYLDQMPSETVVATEDKLWYGLEPRISLLPLKEVAARRDARFVPSSFSFSRVEINIDESPGGTVSIGPDSLKVDSSRLSDYTYYPASFHGEDYLIRKIGKSITLFETFKLATGELLVHELFDIASE